MRLRNSLRIKSSWYNSNQEDFKIPRKRPETKLNKISKMIIEEYQPETVQDLQEVLKDLLDDTM